MHVQKSTITTYIALNDLLSKCSENADSLKIFEAKDRLFLKTLFKNYLPRLIPTDELWRLLREIALLFPDDIKQEMIESNLLFKMYHNERLKIEAEAVPPESRKRKLDADDYEEDDCEIMCSFCSKYFQTSEIGFDGFGETICRNCSQSRGYPIVCMVRLNPAKISKM
jgi:hypothetical protein